METPNTLQAAVKFFADPDNALQYMVSIRWPNGVTCPDCQAEKPSFISTRRIWTCKACKKQFSVKVGTIFEDSPIGLDKWLVAVWLIATCKNGVSSYEISRDLGITQKSTWFMLHRIREAMQDKTIAKFSGEVEADESFIGGRTRKIHKARRARVVQGRGQQGKEIVAPVLQRGGRVRAKVVDKRRKPQLQSLVREHVEAGAELYTDDLKSYDGLDSEYTHQVANHAQEYVVRSNVHTNGIENFWSLLKRGLNGTYVNVEPFHLFRYVDGKSSGSTSGSRRTLSGSSRFASRLLVAG